MTYRVDLTPEKQKFVEAAAASAGMTVEAYIAAAAETQAMNAAIGGSGEDTKEARDAAQRARVEAIRGRRSDLRGTVDDLLRERREEAWAEMRKDLA